MYELTAYLSIFIIGLSYGATACMFSCMPFLTPLLFNSSSSTRESLGVILPFSLGRVFSYTMLSIVAYLSSFWLKKVLDDSAISSAFLGLITVLIGFYMLYKSFKIDLKCGNNTYLNRSGKIGFFTMGSLMSLNPCAPILSLVGISINAKAFYISVFNGLFFGLGAVLVSILFYGFIFSKLIRGLLVELKTYKVYIERFSALFLIILGIVVYYNKLKF